MIDKNPDNLLLAILKDTPAADTLSRNLALFSKFRGFGIVLQHKANPETKQWKNDCQCLRVFDLNGL